MENTKSKIRIYSVFAAILMSFFSLAFVLMIVRGIKISSGFEYLLLLIPIAFLFVGVDFVKSVRYIIIKSNRIRYFSLLRPLGKILYYKDYIGKIIVTERGRAGSYNAVYLIDKNNRTAFKITGVHYSNMRDIIDAIPLQTMAFSPTVKEYYKLLLSGKLTIKEGSNDKKSEKKINKLLVATQIVVVAGLFLMILGYLLRWILG